jgi:4a-hydroxytetrahydrobiopterin dehydratase
VAIEKTYSFADFYPTIAFVNALAFIAHAQNHHPELTVHFKQCVVRWHTHDGGETKLLSASGHIWGCGH